MYKRKEGEPFAAQAARVSLLAPGLAVVVNVFSETIRKESPEAGLAFSAICVFTIAAAFLMAIYALIAIRKHGRKGILGFALAGLLVNGLLIFSVIYSANLAMRIAKDRAARQSPTAPLVISDDKPVFADGTRVNDAALGYSFEVPAGFAEADASALGDGFMHAYLKEHEDGTRSVIGMQHLRARVSGELYKPEHLERMKQLLPPGSDAELMPGRWLGRPINGFVSHLQTEAGPHSTFAFQIPTARESIQLNVVGPAARADENRQIAIKVLQSVRGRPDR